MPTCFGHVVQVFSRVMNNNNNNKPPWPTPTAAGSSQVFCFCFFYMATESSRRSIKTRESTKQNILDRSLSANGSFTIDSRFELFMHSSFVIVLFKVDPKGLKQ